MWINTKGCILLHIKSLFVVIYRLSNLVYKIYVSRCNSFDLHRTNNIFSGFNISKPCPINHLGSILTRLTHILYNLSRWPILTVNFLLSPPSPRVLHGTHHINKDKLYHGEYYRGLDQCLSERPKTLALYFQLSHRYLHLGILVLHFKCYTVNGTYLIFPICFPS